MLYCNPSMECTRLQNLWLLAQDDMQTINMMYTNKIIPAEHSTHYTWSLEWDYINFLLFQWSWCQTQCYMGNNGMEAIVGRLVREVVGGSSMKTQGKQYKLLLTEGVHIFWLDSPRKRGGPCLEVLQYQDNPWQSRSKLLRFACLQKSD